MNKNKIGYAKISVFPALDKIKSSLLKLKKDEAMIVKSIHHEADYYSSFYSFKEKMPNKFMYFFFPPKEDEIKKWMIDNGFKFDEQYKDPFDNDQVHKQNIMNRCVLGYYAQRIHRLEAIQSFIVKAQEMDAFEVELSDEDIVLLCENA